MGVCYVYSIGVGVKKHSGVVAGKLQKGSCSRVVGAEISSSARKIQQHRRWSFLGCRLGVQVSDWPWEGINIGSVGVGVQHRRGQLVKDVFLLGFYSLIAVPPVLAMMNLFWFWKIARGMMKTLSKTGYCKQSPPYGPVNR
ncbi:hypothetical protein TEA_029405 [Camellia sinensis var. sinensis]|uniref:Uncharacterized protein n=1 Tax=Camellia sinensis var. sinensis TaxID=542762 RepID=A0A4V3WJ57_CAMSN|nr:hypothetical protein TEA_029405 [Camellia sinensis var. sinensis]